MELNELKQIVEALLLTSSTPLSLDKLQSVFEEWQQPELDVLGAVLDQLKEDYQTRAFSLVELAGGYQLQTKSQYSAWVARLHMEKPAKYSRALLETLAIIAYKQPVTRADIEELRGVGVNSYIMKTLMEREWIRIAGHKDVVGKPAVYTTTKEFLNYFNLKNLRELPSLPEVLDLLTINTADQPNEECITE